MQERSDTMQGDLRFEKGSEFMSSCPGSSFWADRAGSTFDPACAQ